VDDCCTSLLLLNAEDTVLDIEFDTELSVDNGFNLDKRVGDAGSFCRRVDRFVAPTISLVSDLFYFCCWGYSLLQ
jgi:hypothetical protein